MIINKCDDENPLNSCICSRIATVSVCFLVLSESLARPLRQPAGTGIQHKGRDSDAGDDVTEVRQEEVVQSADWCDVRWGKAAEYDRVVGKDYGSEAAEFSHQRERIAVKCTTWYGTSVICYMISNE